MTYQIWKILIGQKVSDSQQGVANTCSYINGNQTLEFSMKVAAHINR